MRRLLCWLGIHKAKIDEAWNVYCGRPWCGRVIKNILEEQYPDLGG